MQILGPQPRLVELEFLGLGPSPPGDPDICSGLRSAGLRKVEPENSSRAGGERGSLCKSFKEVSRGIRKDAEGCGAFKARAVFEKEERSAKLKAAEAR